MSEENRSRLTLIGKGTRKKFGLYRCTCGVEKEIRRQFVNKGEILSCGCWQQERRCPPSPEEQLQIVQAYTSGVGWLAVGRQFGRGTRTIRRILDSHGIPLRSVSQSLRKYNVDDNAFDRNDAESRYWIGFLLADGHVILKNSQGGVILALAECDGDHVRAFATFLRSEHPVKLKQPGKSALVPNSGMKVGIEVWSYPLAASLAKKGVGPGKTHNATVSPELADDVDFWRGVVDGDGHLYLGRCKYRFGMGSGWNITLGICGTKAVCESFAEFVKRRIGPRTDGGDYSVGSIGAICRVHINGYQALRLADLLYSEATVYLPRKKAIADVFAAYASNL